MLNLNYNINPSSGPGNCRGEVKFNYSASILIVGAGGGGATGVPNVDVIGGTQRSGGGGGGGAVYTGSISIIPNVTYNITVGTAGSGGTIVTASNGQNGQTSSFVGFNDNDTNPLTIAAAGGFGGQYGNGTVGGVGGNSGNLTINGLLISASKSGSAGGATQGGAGGGASMIDSGTAGTTTSGGTGGLGIYNTIIANPDYTVGGGGGGGAKTPADVAGLPNPVNDARSGGWGGGTGTGTGTQNGVAGISYGGGGGGGASAPYGGGFGAGGDGSKGVVIIRYAGEPKAFVTNATTTTSGGFTTHTFETGSGTFLYTYPYPWTDVVPYTVEVCPDEHNEDVRPEVYWDYSYTTNLNRFPYISPFISSSYATMSINAFNSNCNSVVSTNNGLFTTNAQTTVVPSLTGSNWPRTGSVTMSISVAGITYDPLASNQFYSSSFSASSAVYNSTPSITGSILTSSFLASEFYRFYVNANLVHNYSVTIPTNGLIQYLDASNRNSYPGSGSIWYDISGYNHNMSSSFGATFPTWDSSGQYFNFNGTSSAVSTYMTASLSQYSMVVWTKLGTLNPPSSSLAGGAYSIVSGSDFTNEGRLGIQFDSLTYTETQDRRWEIATENNQRDVYSNVTETDTNEFLMIAMTNAGSGSFQNLYRGTSTQPPVIVNAAAPQENAGRRGDTYTGSLVLVGSRYYNATGSLQGYAPEGFYTGSIAGVLFYNRALSANEISDIWNAGI